MVRRRKSKQKRNLSLLLVIGIGVIALIWFSMPSSQVPKEMVKADAHLLISMSGWNPNQFATKVGQPTTVMLMTLGGEASMSDNIHSFILNETGTRVFVKAGQSTTFSITFPHAGTYTFWCTTCCGGVRSPTMAGKVVVG